MEHVESFEAPDELRERAVRIVLDHQHECASQWERIVTVAKMLGPQAVTVRKWVRRVEIDRGSRPGRSSAEVEELPGERHPDGCGHRTRGRTTPEYP